MIPELGHFALILALAVVLLAQTVLPLVGSFRGHAGWVALARPAAWVQRQSSFARESGSPLQDVAFEGIHPSPRHKAGLALRFPRMARWRQDKRVADADSLASLRALLARETGAR